jgi:adenylylsulfate kinase-like enzyme
MIRLQSLLFEVSLDQLKTQFVDTGKITDSEFTEIIDSTGGKSAYATWLTKMVATKTIQPEDLYKYNTYLKVFDRRKREYPFQDINQYKTPQDIAKFINAKGYDVVVSLVAPYKNLRDNYKEELGGILKEIYVHTTNERGREHFHIEEYEIPTENFIDIDTTDIKPTESLKQILEQNGLES